MISFIGDYRCKLDSKGRVALPAAFRKQNAANISDGFVIKKDVYMNCLVLYPMQEWNRQNEIIREKTNPYNPEHAAFIRTFYSGTAELAVDAAQRILIPKKMLELAGIKNEVMLAGQFDKIEIWSPEAYADLTVPDKKFQMLTQEILGGKKVQNSTE